MNISKGGTFGAHLGTETDRAFEPVLRRASSQLGLDQERAIDTSFWGVEQLQVSSFSCSAAAAAAVAAATAAAFEVQSSEKRALLLLLLLLV